MKLFSLNFSTLILRFYLMMGIVIVSFFIGFPLVAILALPVLFISMMGMEFKFPRAFAGKHSEFRIYRNLRQFPKVHSH